MKQLSIFICILFFASSCKKELTFVQKAKEEVFTSKTPETSIPIYEIDATLSASEEPTMLPILNLPTETIEPFQEEDQNWERRKKRKKIQSKKETFFEKVFPNKTTESKQKSKKKPTFRRYNSFIPAGFVILGIAILLALLSLQSLSLLFGLAALLILFIGFKRFFRRKNRRKLFQ
jgi:hypothetical protein